MANRRCLQALRCHFSPFLFTNPPLRSVPLPPAPAPPFPNPPPNALTSTFLHFYADSRTTTGCAQWSQLRYFSSSNENDGSNEDRGIEEDGSDVEEEIEDEDVEGEISDNENVSVSSGDGGKKEYTALEKEEEAAAIGYKVIGPLDKSDRVFKPYEPVFAVVQIGSHQFKVSNGDCIFAERLKFCEVNDKLILHKVLLLGSSGQTIVGRPIVPDAAVHAVVEEHALDAKVIIFKKKRRKNYRRTKGHRQELTKLRITDIQGIEKPQDILAEKSSKAAKKKQEKVAVTA